MGLRAPLLGLLALLVGPFVLAWAGGFNGQRSFSQELGSTLGISALCVLALVLLLPTRLRPLAGLGADAAVRLHRHLVGVLIALITAHVVLAVALQPARYALLRFYDQPWRAQAAISSTVCLIVLIALSVWRRRLRLPYAVWRALHGGLAAATLALAALHTYGWHRYLGRGLGQVALVALVGLPIGALVMLRLRSRRRATYLLERVVAEAGRSTSLVLHAQDQRGRSFQPGQFAWLRLADGATRFAEHPFSYTSSAEDPSRIEVAVRAYDGFSARVARLPAGTRFQVDGPHGAFRIRARAKGVLLLAYGIGITPSMSILRTAADRRDTRAFLVVYANRTIEDATFAEKLQELQTRLDLRVVHVLSRPENNWTGERGRITADILYRHLPEDLAGWDVFLCGAGGAVDAGVAELADVGIAPEHVHAERFVEV